MKEEELIKEETKNTKKRKKKSHTGIYVIIILTVLILFGALIVALNNVGLLKIDSLEDAKNGKKATLKYTETTKAKSDGVYITDVSEVVEEVMPSIVAITSKTLVRSGAYGPSFFGGENQYSEGAGSGIIISQTEDEILILTNNHVVEGAEELAVQFINEKSADATIKGTSEKSDVAVIAVKLKNLDKETQEAIRIATMGDSSALKVGNGIIAIGNALGYGQSVTTGVVSALDRDVTVDEVTKKMIQIDAAINGGNSGGALLNSAGEVVGINSVKYSTTVYTQSASIEGMGFAIPITDVKDIIEELMNGRDVDESDPMIGIEGNMVSSNAYGMPTGFYISKVIDGTGADEAGLEIGNIITKIEGKTVTRKEDISGVLSRKKKGDTVTLTIAYANRKAYEEKEVEVTLS